MVGGLGVELQGNTLDLGSELGAANVLDCMGTSEQPLPGVLQTFAHLYPGECFHHARLALPLCSA